MRCEGTEASLLHCNHSELGQTNCKVKSDCVQVYCVAGGPQPPAVLTHNSDGIVSLTYDGQARAVCDTGFTDETAHVICLELYGAPEFHSYSHGHQCQYKTFWTDQVACVGHETNIAYP